MASKGPDPTTNMRRIEFRLAEKTIEEADKVAYELSDPGPRNNVSRADVLREAVVKFLRDFDPETESLNHGKLSDSENGSVEP